MKKKGIRNCNNSGRKKLKKQVSQLKQVYYAMIISNISIIKYDNLVNSSKKDWYSDSNKY